MGSATITFRVEDAERVELVGRAERDKVSLSDYIRVRLGLRGQGSQADDEIEIVPAADALREQLADHEQRLHVLEEGFARSRSADAS
jgi:hypothetical protein